MICRHPQHFYQGSEPKATKQEGSIGPQTSVEWHVYLFPKVITVGLALKLVGGIVRTEFEDGKRNTVKNETGS
jgi:hypothetical protein